MRSLAFESIRGSSFVLAALAPVSVALSQGTVPIVVVREERLIGGDTAPDDHFGASMALSGDTLVVGSPLESSPSPTRGAAYVFVRSASGWVEQQKLVANDGATQDRFGSAVAIEGDTIAVGSPSADTVAGDAGAVYLFHRTGSIWSQTAKLVGNGADSGEFLGISLDLEGDTLAAGAADDHHSGGQTNGGAVYVYVNSALGWQQQQRVVAAGGEAFDYFAHALDLEGDTLIVGAYSDNHTSAANGGSIYAFDRAGGVWTQTQKFVPADNGSNDGFGWSLDLAGSTLAVGAIGDTIGGNFSAGSVYLLSRQPAGFTQVQKLALAAPTQYENFGSGVSLDGELLLVGAMGSNTPTGTVSGSAYLYQRTVLGYGSGFQLRSTVAEQGASFGYGALLRGERAFIGCPGDDTPVIGQNTGSVLSYRVEPESQTYCTAKVNGLGCTPAIGFSGTPSVSSALPYFVTAGYVVNRKTGLLVYSLSPASTPFQGGTLCVAAPIRRTVAQDSGGSPNANDCTGNYLFDFNAWIRSGTDPELSPGTEVFAQYWSRDPFSPIPIGLTDALHFHVRP